MDIILFGQNLRGFFFVCSKNLTKQFLQLNLEYFISGPELIPECKVAQLTRSRARMLDSQPQDGQIINFWKLKSA